MLSSREVAEDVTQDWLMSVWRQAATYQSGVGRVKPWLLSISHHRAIDRIRRVREWQSAATNAPGGERVVEGALR